MWSLSRFSRPIPYTLLYKNVNFPRFFANSRPNFSSSAYEGWKQRMNTLQSTYPNLFGDKFISDQEKLLTKRYNDNELQSWINEYESSRQKINSGIESNNALLAQDIFIPLTLKEVKNKYYPKKPIYTHIKSDEEAKTKLNIGEKWVQQLLQKQSQSGLSNEQSNLRMIELANYADKIEAWKLRLDDSSDSKENDKENLELPISDEELDAWVNYQYYHAPDHIRDPSLVKHLNKDMKQEEENWLLTLDDKLFEMLKDRNTNFDENKFRDFTKTTNEMFHPLNIDHYNISDYAKGLFRAALWQSKERLNKVEESINIIQNLYENQSDDDQFIIRKMLELYPNDIPLKHFVALQLKILDPLFAARLMDKVRTKLEKATFKRAVKDVMRDIELPNLQQEKEEVKKELVTQSNNTNLKRELNNINNEIESYNSDIPSLESIVDKVISKHVTWSKTQDYSSLKEAMISYAKGESSSLNAIDDELNKLFDPHGENIKLNNDNLLSLHVKYHNARYENKNWWNFSDFLNEINDQSNENDIKKAQNIIKEKFKKNLKIDSLVINLINILIEDKKTDQLSKIIGDFKDIMKRYRGEIDATVVSAHDLDDHTFNAIAQALQAANPQKKITLNRQVDSGLQSGFIVKAGVTKLDFSLAKVVDEGRKAVGN